MVYSFIFAAFLKKIKKLKIMQNRNVIKIFAILFAIVSLYQLSFTWVAGGVENDAIDYASDYPVEPQDAGLAVLGRRALGRLK